MKQIIKAFLSNQKSNGFTIIELVLVMAILSIIAGSSFVGFSQYNKTLKLNAEAENLKTNLNEAKSSALSGFINNCNNPGKSLYGYQLSIKNASQYSISEVCAVAGVPQTPIELTNKIFNLQSGITFTAVGTSVTFLAVTGIPVGAQTFTLTSGSRFLPVSVDPSGVIK